MAGNEKVFPLPDDVVLKVSGSKRGQEYTKSVANAICWRLRDAGFCKACAVKMDAVNTAIKAIATTNKKVQKAGVVLSVDLSLADVPAKEGEPLKGVSMTIQETPIPKPAQFVEYKVSGKGDGLEELAVKLAYSVASLIRQGKGVKLRCLGPASVYKAVLAVITAKKGLLGERTELAAVPEWSSLTKAGSSETVSLIVIHLWGGKQGT